MQLYVKLHRLIYYVYSLSLDIPIYLLDNTQDLLIIKPKINHKTRRLPKRG